MKTTMKELAKKYYWITLADLWDELCNDLPMYYSEEDIAEEYTKRGKAIVQSLHQDIIAR